MFQSKGPITFSNRSSDNLDVFSGHVDLNQTLANQGRIYEMQPNKTNTILRHSENTIRNLWTLISAQWVISV